MSLLQIKIIEYITMMSENFGKTFSKPLQKQIIDELQYFSIEQIERGFKELLRDYDRMPNLAVILKYVKGAHQPQTKNILPEYEPSADDRYITHLFLNILARNLRENKRTEYMDLLEEIARRAVEHGIDPDYVENKMNNQLQVFRREDAQWL